MAPVRRVRVLVSGLVQGVFYRASTREKGLELGLCGWVQNLPDGRVEAVFQGSAQRVDAAVGWCRQGPSHARVDEVAVTDLPPGDELTGFEVRPPGANRGGS